MVSCEMCGADAKLTRVRISGSEMNVCNSCKSMGNEVDPKPTEYSHSFYKGKKKSSTVEEVIPNYASKIQSELAKKGLVVQQLARIVNIKESSLNNYLKGSIKLDVENAKKIANYLEITLTQEVDSLDDDYEDFTSKEESESQSLGDMLLKELNKKNNQ